MTALIVPVASTTSLIAPRSTFAVKCCAGVLCFRAHATNTAPTTATHTKMSHIRPAHIHFAVSAPGHHYLVTHLFQKGDEYINNDVVYGVKAPLVVEFVKRPPGKAPNGETVDTPFYEVKYDFVMEQKQAQLAAAE